MMTQRVLFAPLVQLPEGFTYRPDFITADEETTLLDEIRALPFHEARYKEYTAKRRIVSYGGSYDFSTNELIPAGPIPPFLEPLRDRIANWVQVPASEFQHALIAEYRPGTQLGWHRDVPEFDLVVGVSLGGYGRMRLRPYPPAKGRNPDIVSVDLGPRSAYVIQESARWGWQHSIAGTQTLRYSVTFRTRRQVTSR